MRWYRVALLATMPEEDQTERSIRSESRDSGSSFSKRKKDRKKKRKTERKTGRKTERKTGRKEGRQEEIKPLASLEAVFFSVFQFLTHLPNLVP